MNDQTTERQQVLQTLSGSVVSVLKTSNGKRQPLTRQRPQDLTALTKPAVEKKPTQLITFPTCSTLTPIYVNDKYDRHGNLFQRPFCRKLIDSDNYLQQVVIYIHNNPLHHGFVHHPADYPWSSYHTCLSPKPTKLRRDATLDWFGGIVNVKEVHDNYSDHTALGAWLEMEAREF